MEKLVYVLWKGKDVAIEEHAAALRETAQRWSQEVHGLTVNVADEAAAFARNLRIAPPDETLSATFSVWLDTHLARREIEADLVAIADRAAGYLVVESVPLLGTRYRVTGGERVPGFCTVAFLEKPAFLTPAEWIERWQGQHTAVAVATQSTFLYVQNVIVRALTPEAPPWSAIVEECFPAEAAADPMAFYGATSAEQLAERQGRMLESCRRFIDFHRLQSHPMSAYVFKLL